MSISPTSNVSQNGSTSLRTPINCLKFSHIGIAVANVEKAVISYQQIFGYTVCSGPVVDPLQKVSVCFLSPTEAADPVIELVAPTAHDSPVSRILATAVGAYHLCYEVDNIAEELERIRAHGCIVISGPVPAIAFAGRRIAWVYTPTHQLIELLEHAAPADLKTKPATL